MNPVPRYRVKTGGDPLPAIQVQGRTADLLTFPTRSGEPVTIAPLALSLALEPLPGIELFQIVHTAPTDLSIRLQPTPRADRPPQQTTGGKFRAVIPLT